MEVAPPEGAESLPRSRWPLGLKLVDRPEFSSGMLLLPPEGVKHSERPPSPEVFYVASGAPNCIVVRIHNSEFKLSKGDSFYVPADTVYSVRNTSPTRSASFFFTLATAQAADQ